jgi:hypothetical protein
MSASGDDFSTWTPLGLLSTNVQAAEATTAIEILMDDSGVLQSPKEASPYEMALLAHIKKLARRRSAAKAHIDVISTSYGRTVWTGTPQDLKRNGERAQDLVGKIAFGKERCNNLPGAFDELKSNIAALERDGYTDVHVLVFSSLIHTPRPCGDMKTIALPQLPPVEGNINGALIGSKALRSITFYWISPHQRAVWEEFLAPALAWASLNGVRYDLFDEVRTRSALREGIAPLEVRP